ncbi:MAG: hypothetical protein A3G18_11045 [Rhodospirillales bacterium RIFCSPLOWO2_12_FULL_58_28]|nr:MAG: hypothetical protein A3H92_03525 [Rhodospirillales bacterium RIFCSPLOWO2_02_FULL_58_16]OHC77826.1 MAG: hypothetical protein A3G18_11045 [Rhodospirillales bacterium RIFCSPLOWO2_12_FULL_58_28]
MRDWPSYLWTALWALTVAVALVTRPLLPVDETRYLAVAWEMWLKSEFLVPYLNGEPYSHKPPLLFWLIHLGWAAFGVNEWWPRLAAPFFGLGSLFLTARMARRLWPDIGGSALTAPLILSGCLFWSLFATLTMFDLILAFCALVGLLGVLRAWRGDYFKGFAALGVGIGVGMLAKGPAILPHVLPAALLAPLWGEYLAGGHKADWKRWYMGVAAALALGVAIALAWAVPAAVRGGEDYADAIFWGQSAGRMVHSFAHGRSWWWYLAVLSPLILPWIVWPALWRAARGSRAAMNDGGVRFCLSWFLPAFLTFSLISGKQLHYLLPVFPALALIFAFLLSKSDPAGKERQIDRMVPGLFFVFCGVVIFILPFIGGAVRLPQGTADMLGEWGLPVLAAGTVAAMIPASSIRARAAALSALSTALVVSLHMSAKPVFAAAYDLKPMSLRLNEWERQGYALAFFGVYHGQFHFLGRLEKRMEPIGVIADDEARWMQAFDKGKVVTYYEKVPTIATPDLVLPFRNGFYVVWDKKTVIEHPGLARRS